MHKSRDKRSSSLNNDETNNSTSNINLFESACLPIGCDVSAKYRGAFCSAQIKTIDRQIKLKVALIDTGETITISEEQIVQPVPLRTGNTVTIRLPSSNRHNNSNLSHIGDNCDIKEATIKHIHDNSVYTVVFNDGDEKSLRRSSICLQGIRLYQTQTGQRKFLEDVPTTLSTPLSPDNDDKASVVAIQRHGHNSQHIFPALILKRKTLADYIWVKSFIDGREYIVHRHNDIKPYKNNPSIQSLCRLTSKKATQACDKFIRYQQIPAVWRKKKIKSKTSGQYDDNQSSDSSSDTSDTDMDETDDESPEEKDSFVAKLFSFMDDRGTSINNTPKVQNYDIDLHRLFNIVRKFGGYNKVTKNDRWNKVYIKMGLPDEPSAKTSRSIENIYKKYLLAYEGLSRKLGTISSSSTYFGSRTSMSSDSRRSLIRVRHQSDSKSKSTSTKHNPLKTLSNDSKVTVPSTRTRKTIVIKNRHVSSTSESNISDDETAILSRLVNTKFESDPTMNSAMKKSLVNTKQPKKSIRLKCLSSSTSLIDQTQLRERSNSPPTIQRARSATDSEYDMKPVIKIKKISYDVLKHSTVLHHKSSKQQTISQPDVPSDPCDQEQSKMETIHSEEQVTPLSSSTTSSNANTPSMSFSCVSNMPIVIKSSDDILESEINETPSIFQTITESSSVISDGVETSEFYIHPTNSTKRSYSIDDSENTSKINDSLPYSKRTKRSISTQDNQSSKNSKKILTYDDINIDDILVVKRKKQYNARCIKKNDDKQRILVQYDGLDTKNDEWINIRQILERKSDIKTSFDRNLLALAKNSDEQNTKKNASDDEHTKISKPSDKEPMYDNKIIPMDQDIPGTSSSEDKKVDEFDHLEEISSATNIYQSRSNNDIQGMIIKNSSLIQNCDFKPNLNHDDDDDIIQYQINVAEETIDDSSITQQSVLIKSEHVISPNSPSDNTSRSISRSKRRTYRDPNSTKEMFISPKKRTRTDADLNSNYNVDLNSEHQPIESSLNETKRYRTVGKRNMKRTICQQDNDNDNVHTNSPINMNLRQQIETMFKQRTSRYNFLDLNNNLTGDNRLNHLKDRMRECQRVFFNLRSALKKIEKQKRLFIRKQKQLNP